MADDGDLGRSVKRETRGTMRARRTCPSSKPPTVNGASVCTCVARVSWPIVQARMEWEASLYPTSSIVDTISAQARRAPSGRSGWPDCHQMASCLVHSRRLPAIRSIRRQHKVLQKVRYSHSLCMHCSLTLAHCFVEKVREAAMVSSARDGERGLPPDDTSVTIT